ncbi:C39 family peptidase [Facklamia sp. P12934]|uniref:C39 family peptidase n=1 Tax=unclassified Facklamia TaxID=2622293 RepID=UPI003D17DD50
MHSFQDKINRLAAFLSLITILLSLSLTFYLNHLSTKENTSPEKVTTSNQALIKKKLPSVKNETINEETATEEEKMLALELNKYGSKTASIQDVQESIADIIRTDYQGNIMSAQQDIVQAINENQMSIEREGTLFLPDQPSFASKNSYLQMDVPLILQKSPLYSDIDYGASQQDTLGDNGCAIVSLAMVYSYLSNRLVEPEEVLEWSGRDYFFENEGTSWTIFSDYATDHGFNFYNHGNNFYSAMEAVQKGQVVIASVKPGFFTDVGHIIVIRGYEPGYVYVNDPNDNPEKMYSFQPINEQILLDEGLNYWSFYND